MLTLDPKIIEAFAAVGITLEYIPADTNAKHDIWQYDGGPNGAIIELWVGINGAGREGVFGTYDAGDFGQQYSLSSCMSDWLENYGQYLPFIAKGEDFDW
jgi:hypothetical protein